MFGYTWTQLLSWISLVLSALALVVSFSKFFIELYDRKQRIKKEKENEKEAMKAKFIVDLQKPFLVINNDSESSANIKEILLDGNTWEESDLFVDDRPTFISGKQSRTFKISASFVRQYPKGVVIQYADDYSRKFMDRMHEEDFEV